MYVTGKTLDLLGSTLLDKEAAAVNGFYPGPRAAFILQPCLRKKFSHMVVQHA